jgi:virulence-associated protein VagC
MRIIAHLFFDGDDQAVRLPDGFDLPGDEVWIRKNQETGELVLTPKFKLDDRRTTVTGDDRIECDQQP